jgi:hypothetical protein
MYHVMNNTYFLYHRSHKYSLSHKDQSLISVNLLTCLIRLLDLQSTCHSTHQTPLRAWLHLQHLPPLLVLSYHNRDMCPPKWPRLTGGTALGTSTHATWLLHIRCPRHLLAPWETYTASHTCGCLSWKNDPLLLLLLASKPLYHLWNRACHQ